MSFSKANDVSCLCKSFTVATQIKGVSINVATQEYIPRILAIAKE